MNELVRRWNLRMDVDAMALTHGINSNQSAMDATRTTIARNPMSHWADRSSLPAESLPAIWRSFDASRVAARLIDF